MCVCVCVCVCACVCACVCVCVRVCVCVCVCKRKVNGDNSGQAISLVNDINFSHKKVYGFRRHSIKSKIIWTAFIHFR